MLLNWNKKNTFQNLNFPVIKNCEIAYFFKDYEKSNEF